MSSIVALAHWSHDNVLDIVINGQVNCWLLHHLYFFVCSLIVVTYHLFDIILMALACSIAACAMMRVSRLLALALLHWTRFL